MDGIGETEETGWYLVLLATGNEFQFHNNQYLGNKNFKQKICRLESSDI